MPDQDIEVSELELLKERADTMGIDYHPKIGAEALRKKINVVLDKPTASTEGTGTLNQNKNAKRQALLKEATRLIRVVVLNQNPTKKEWRGEYLGVSNAAIGTIKRYVPYDVETHVEAVLVKQLKSRQMTRFYTELNENKQKVRKFRLVPEFSVSELEPLSKDELQQLADDQVKRNAID